eukprot:3052671-Pleurochrysis_carterae.AAC.5
MKSRARSTLRNGFHVESCSIFPTLGVSTSHPLLSSDELETPPTFCPAAKSQYNWVGCIETADVLSSHASAAPANGIARRLVTGQLTRARAIYKYSCWYWLQPNLGLQLKWFKRLDDSKDKFRVFA